MHHILPEIEQFGNGLAVVVPQQAECDTNKHSELSGAVTALAHRTDAREADKLGQEGAPGCEMGVSGGRLEAVAVGALAAGRGAASRLLCSAIFFWGGSDTCELPESLSGGDDTFAAATAAGCV